MELWVEDEIIIDFNFKICSETFFEISNNKRKSKTQTGPDLRVGQEVSFWCS